MGLREEKKGTIRVLKLRLDYVPIYLYQYGYVDITAVVLRFRWEALTWWSAGAR